MLKKLVQVSDTGLLYEKFIERVSCLLVRNIILCFTVIISLTFCVIVCSEWFHGSVHGRSGEPRRRCSLSAPQLRQPNTRYRGNYCTGRSEY